MTEGRGNTFTTTGEGQPAPTLLEPMRLPVTRGAVPALALVGVVAVLAIAAVVSFSGVGTLPASLGGSQPSTTAPPVALPSDIRGAFLLMDQDLAIDRPHLVGSLAMPERERQRVTDSLRAGGLRIAAITLWDTIDADADVVTFAAAGFTQILTISHQPATFFVPVVPGGTVRITAARDGGGGGVTLGVRTLLGPIALPPLAPGQTIEVPVL